MQPDREAKARRVLEKYRRGIGGKYDRVHDEMVRDILAFADAARREALENAAGVAEDEAHNWRASVVGGTVRYAMEAVKSAVLLEDIAKTIRALPGAKE